MIIDRLTPALRPAGKNAGTQKWRELLFVHWPVETSEVRALLPAALEPDLFEGVAYLGLVPFAMQDVRPAWLPRAMALDFLETNLRLYVHHQGRPGVYFLSLEAASFLAVKAARMGWSLPYYHASMHMQREANQVSYSSRRRPQAQVGVQLRYQIGDALDSSQPGTLQHFLLERYLLFAHHRGRLHCGQVHHTPYPVHQATIVQLDESLSGASGVQRTGEPAHVHYSPGVDVEVFSLSEVS